MKYRISITLLLILILKALPAQDFGLAVQDQVRAPLINPAALGVGNAAGIGYIQDYSEEELERNYDFIFSLGGLAYVYQRNEERSDHLLAGGIEAGQGFYPGASFSWTGEGGEDSRLGLSLLYRPVSFISLALKGENLSSDPYTEAGIGVRPFFAQSSRLTLSGDARIDEDGYSTLSAGVFLEPLDGLKIFGDYNFDDEVLELGVSLAYSRLETGVSRQSGEDSSAGGGQVHIYSSLKRQRSALESGFRKAVDYDMARLIQDSPGRREGRSLMDFIRDMEEIKADPAVKVLIFRNQDFQTSFANILEVETILKEIKATGREIIFYYDSLENMPYALAASVADEIYLSPAGSVNLRGFSTSRIYLKDFLSDWGIRFQNFRSHPYKTASNTFSEFEMTAEEREALEYFYAGLHEQMFRMLNEGRRTKFRAKVEEILDEGPFIFAEQALETGLVDGLLYKDEFDRLIEKKGLSRVPYSQLTARIQYRWEGSGRPTVALIYAEGAIHSGEGLAGRTIGADSLSQAIRAARNNPLVKGIILRVNSGGGSSLASDLIAREVALCRSGDRPKPIVVSMGGAAASGGYYIAAPADKIVASPGTVTGSIGVIAVLPEISGLLARFGIGSETIRTAGGADTGSILRPLNSSEEEKMRAYIAAVYEQFISLVGEYREMSNEEVHEQAQGRIWTGIQAMDRGLVDETGGLGRAIALAEELTGSSSGIRLIEMVPGRGLSLLERAVPSLAARSGSEEKLLLRDLESLLAFYSDLKRYEEGEALYLMPYTEVELGVMP